MRIKTFFLFPESDEDFIRIGDDPESYKNLIGEIAIIKQQLRNHNNYELCYDSENIAAFLSKAQSLIKEEYLADCRTQLKILFGNYSRNLSTSVLKKADCLYVNWDITCKLSTANNILSEVAESKHSEGTDRTILVSIADSYQTNRDFVYVIKDAIQYDDLPILISIPIVKNEISFSEWYSSLNNPQFSLKDKTRFQLTAFRWEKQSIYQDVNTGNFWYFDYFHKDNKRHYEVFNSVGDHLGEANEQGELQVGTDSNKKKICNIIK